MDEFLKEIKKLTERFAKENPKWKSIVYSGNDDGKFDEIENDLETLYFDAVKYVVKNSLDKDELDKELIKILGNKVFIGLRSQMKAAITIFESANVISDISEPAFFISQCFSRAILRRDMDFGKEWESFGFSTVGDMVGAINAISSIAFNNASMALSKNSAYAEFKKMTGLDDSVCSFYAEKYDDCYEGLQNRILIKNQREISNYMRLLMDALSDEDE